MKRKYLFLYLRTGGGHFAPARAIADILEREASGIAEPVLFDGLHESIPLIRYLLEEGYRILQNRFRWYYAFLYFISGFKPVGLMWTSIVSIFVRRSLERQILSQRPQQIAVFHFFLIKPVIGILRRHRLQIPVHVVVTDPFTAHPVWFFNKGVRYAVFSDRLRQDCVSRGIDPALIRVFPGIVNERFSECISDEKMDHVRRELGIHNGEKVVLLIGGRDGIPNGIRLIRSFFRTSPDFSVIAVCGRHEGMRRTLESLRDRFGWKKLILLGFSDEVPTLLHLADIVVTKCGASICMEVLAARKIAVVHRYLWGQEKGNVEFLTENHFGYYEPRTKKLAHRVAVLLKDPDNLRTAMRTILTADVPNGAQSLARYLLTNDRIHPSGEIEENYPYPADRLSLVNA